MRTRNLIFTALIGVAVTAPGVSAQTGNQSDVTGALVTSFIGSAFSGTSITLTGAQSLAIMNAMNALDLGLQGNTLVSSTGLPLTLSSAFRAALNEILSSPTPSNEAKAALAAALMTMAGGSSATSSGSGVVSAPWPYAGIGTGAVRSAALDEATDELIAALSGLFAAFGEMEPGDIEIRPTERLIHAVDEWNEFLNTLPEESLRNPSAEFLAIHSILTQLVAAADATDDVGVENNDIGEVEGQVDE